MLLGVNLFLLVLVAGREARSAQYLERARDEAVSILEKNGIAMTAALPREMTLTAMTVTRDAAAEQAQAAGLLGEAAAAEDGAGSYRGEKGTARFSADGTFSVSLNAGAYPQGGELPGRFGLACLRKMGFEGEASEYDEASGTLTVRQTWQDAPVFSCVATLTYEDGELRGIQGDRLTGTPSAEAGETPLTVATVLLRFLAYLKDTGVICREIRSMTAGYTLSTVQINPVYMAPAWYIVTDIQSYYMDAVTGVVTVAG